MENQILKILNAEIGYKSKNKKKILLKNLNLDVQQGETVAILGVNGAGKSTLLRSIASLHDFISGEILLKNKSISNFTKKELAKTISFISTENINTDFLKIEDFIGFWRYPHTGFGGNLSKNDKKIISNALQIVGMENFANKNLNEISDGERQKIMIAGAISQDTDIILLDEPTSFLDLENKYSIYQILQDLSDKKEKSIIFSTHDLSIALKNADKIWLVKNKSIIQSSPEDLILSNMFDDFFSNNNILFDYNSANFIFQKSGKISAYINNQSKNNFRKRITILALKRVKIKSSETNENTDFELIITNSFWHIKQKDKEYKFYSIYDMNTFLKNMY